MRRNVLHVYAMSALLGLLTGTVGSCLMLAIQKLTALISQLFEVLDAKGWPIGLLSALLSMLMVYSAWLLVKWVATDASGSGVQEIEGALLHKRPVRWRRVLPIKFFGGILSISSQLVVGREGPTIQIGGNLGQMLGEWFQLPRHHVDALIAAGAAAGLATAFNAPLAGILFVLEEMRSQFHFSFTNFTAVTVCCVVAVIVLHLLVGAGPAIPMAVFSLPSLPSLGLFFIFGLLVGGVGLLFNLVLMKSLAQIDKLGPKTRDGYVLLIGLMVGFLAYLKPEMVGGGYAIIERSLTMSPSLSLLVLLVIVRFITTMLSYSTGAPGGIFAPMLALGTLLGLAASHGLNFILSDTTVHPQMFAVAGMGALFAAVVRAPVTGIVLVVEMTQNYALILPLMVTCLTATTVVQLAGNQPIYTQLLHRTLNKEVTR
ncbi:MAG: H(+)/Cl(-) exchange transporter ClcA [Legionellales bacterium]|nr:H(+)/Cl(-) exchange transporter ClcA [Legionellales bacterium]